MITKWISRLFGAELESAPAAARTQPAGTSQPAAGAALSDDELDAEFFHWISAQGAQAARPGLDAIIIEELGRLLHTPATAAGMVPRVPAVIPQLLRSLRDEAASGADLARQISQDVVLVAEVVREANSPFYAPTAPVKNIEGAVMLLGQNGLRMLLARVAFRPVISQQTGHFARLAAPHIWASSEKTALAASLLAPAAGQPQFEAYLAGLVAGVGLIVAFRMIDQIHQDPVLPQSDAFCRHLYEYARMLSVRIARLWDLPAPVIEAIELARDAERPALADVLARAGRVAQLRMLHDARRLPQDDASLAALSGQERRAFDKLGERAT
ncbi:MAG: HDOD domain-containing protein [Telluria sp.]